MAAIAPPPVGPRSSTRTVAVIGPPNCGKSSLFNRLTGLRQKVANFPGATVDIYTGDIALGNGTHAQLVDLPGIYSLTPSAEDERVACDVLTGRREDVSLDAIILVLDVTALDRHLPLAAQIVALGRPTLVVLNMADELSKRGGSVDVLTLARQIGTPVVLASAATGQGIDAIRRFLESKLNAPAPMALPVVQTPAACREWARTINESAGYRRPASPVWTRRLDAAFLHPVWGIVIFALVVLAVFEIMFFVGQPITDLMEASFNSIGQWARSVLPENIVTRALIDGAFTGVTSVLGFLPQVLVLFLFIGVLEDSGYLARAAVITDRTMGKIGLNGKAFIPLLSAHACAVPAVMAARIIEDKRDRMATILVAPFMTCSARLPVYVMVIAAFLPDRQLPYVLINERTAALVGLYALGFFAALFTAKVLKSSILRSPVTPFVMELPQYRWPNARLLTLRMYDCSKGLLIRAGTVILVASLILWAMSQFPLKNGQPPELQDSMLASMGKTIEPVIAPLGFDWRIGVGLISSVAARETIIATLGTVYGIDPENQADAFQTILQRELTPASAAALLVFFAFAMQCISTIAVVRRETRSWSWPLGQFVGMTAFAYVAAWIAYVVTSKLAG